MNISPLVEGLKKRKEMNATPVPESERLLQMILTHMKTMVDHFTAEKPQAVTTQESHTP